jgi:hypothetical protein
MTTGRWRKTIRTINPHSQIDYVLDPSGQLDTKYVDYHLLINFQNSTFIEVGKNPSYEYLAKPLPDLARERHFDSRRRLSLQRVFFSASNGHGQKAFRQWPVGGRAVLYWIQAFIPSRRNVPAQ